MQPHDTSLGFTLIELLVAVTLLSGVALALSTTLITTHRLLAASGKRMQAAQLAAEALEQLRAGQVPRAGRLAGDFERSTLVTPWGGHPVLRRLEVTVSWNDGDTHTLQLVTLARR
jgi:prepilin-type N-terminal cleavage/methylation domain-containing protein